MTIHGKCCYTSDPKDKWFNDSVEVEDNVSIHVEKFLHDDNVTTEDEHSIHLEKHLGGYEFALSSGPINAPRSAVFNAPGTWEPTSFVEVEDSMQIEVHRHPNPQTPPGFPDGEYFLYESGHGETWKDTDPQTGDWLPRTPFKESVKDRP